MMICFYVVIQCINGHIVCSNCYNKLQQICLKCSNCLIRCRAFENLLNSIQMFCPNKKYGCKERISYIRDMDHVEECIHVPCYCPVSSCDYVGSSEVLSNHFSYQHGDSRIKFSYGHSFIVSFKSNDKTTVLQEETDRKLFILNNRPVNLGNAVNISCIGPSYSDQHYHCDILARSQICTLKLESFVKNVQRVNLATLSSNFLLIPFEHFGSSELLNLEICISPKVPLISSFSFCF
jgi:E3 ubiquitin-protein ligase SIAH1